MDPQQILQFPHVAAPAASSTLEVAPGVHWLRMPLPFALDHINLWLLEDGQSWTIIDCGIASEKTKALWEPVLAAPGAGGRPFHAGRVLVTHFHPDHAGLAHWLCQRFGAELWMTQAEYLTAHAIRETVAGYTPEQLLAMYAKNGLAGAELEKMATRGNRYRQVVPGFPTSYRRLMDGSEVAIGGRSWRVLTGYGHSPEHAALYCAELGVLISGDMLLPKISTNISVSSIDPEGNPLQHFLDSIKRYAALPPDTLVLPSHGLPFRGMRERIEQLEEHHAQRCQDVLDACERPLSAFDAVPALFSRELDMHQLFFALGEAMAHLHYLHYRGALAREVGSDGVIRFRRIA